MRPQSCQLCKAAFPSTLTGVKPTGPQERGTFSWMIGRTIKGQKGHVADPRKGDFSLVAAPHIALLSLYRGGLGVKRCLDRLGEPRGKLMAALEIIKGGGGITEGRRPPAPVADPANVARKAEERKQVEARIEARRIERESVTDEQRRAAQKARALACYYKNHATNKARAAARARAMHAQIKDTPEYIIKASARSATNRITRIYKGRKIGRTLSYLGCTHQQARDHIEKQFKRGMNWGNHGDWEIDHIIPLSRFDLTRQDEMHRAMHFTNLQPLWREENRSKSDNFTQHQPELLLVA